MYGRENQMHNNPYNFQKLTPIDNVELGIYEKALDFVFNNDDIKNIAICGPYCSGKSSVLESYKKKRPRIKFLHISLAHFDEITDYIEKDGVWENDVLARQTENYESSSERNNSKKSLKEDKEFVLEGKILNQLIHQINPKNIPQTHFKIKQEIPKWKIIIFSSGIILFMISIAFTFGFGRWSQYVSALSAPWLKCILGITTKKEALLISGAFCILFLWFAVKSLIKAQFNRNMFKKISLQGNEIEIFAGDDGFCFDKHLNEVLYLFVNAGADVIVFEDIDRHDNNLIFERLREINFLANKKLGLKKSNKKVIRFFYLLKDDIFTSKDRTKFFDFIIPIVPVIDSSNAYEQLIAHLEQGGILEMFDKSFLRGLSYFIDDMRILKNICNEYVIYYDRIKNIDPDCNKLFALIAYKNIFPKDFNELQLGRGFVYTILFENKFKEKKLQYIDSEIQKIEEEIKSINKETLDSIDELDTLYLSPMYNNRLTSVNQKRISEFKSNLELVKFIKMNKYKGTYYNQYQTYPQDLEPLFKELLQNKEYIQRKETIEKKSGKYIENLREKINNLERQKTIIQNGKLHDIISNEDIDTIFNVISINEIGEQNDFREIKGSPYFPLIKYLVRNGYIDETYSDYMTYFYEKSISQADKVFLRSVLDKKPKKYSYSLNDPQKVFAELLELGDFYFEHEEILNFDLLRYLLKTERNNREYLLRFLQQIKDKKNYKFINEFLLDAEQGYIGQFIKEINHLWPDIFDCFLTESNLSEAQKKKYALYTLYFSPEEDIKALNKDNCLTNFISNNPTFLNIVEPDIQKIISGFALIGVKFSWIDYDKSNKELFDAVYENNQYQLTFDLICLMLKTKYGESENDDFRYKNYTLIISRPNEPLALYVKENINDYLDVIVENCNQYIADEEFAVLEILNNEEIDVERKKKYIFFLGTIIQRISDVKDIELWSLLLEQKQVGYSEENILNYFIQKGWDGLLVEFINGSTIDLNFDYDLITEKFGEDSTSEFSDAIVSCNELSNDKYEAIVSSLNIKYEAFTFKELNDEKIIILIELDVIEMNKDNLNFIREYYPKQLPQFIVRNIAEYTDEVINEENFDLNELLLILDKKLPDKYLIKLLGFADKPISIKEKNYSTAIKKHILQNNFDIYDLPYLLESYPQQRYLKKHIKEIALENIELIMTKRYLISLDLLLELLAVETISMETRKILLLNNLQDLNAQETTKCLKTMKMFDFLDLFNGKRPKIEKNEINRQILKEFENKGWITKYEDDPRYPNFYRVNGRKIMANE